MDTEKFSNEFMKTLLLNKTKRQRFANAQKFYWNCIRDNGYSDLQQDQSTNESSDELDEYSDFIPKETDTIDKFCERCNSELSSSQQCKICNIYSSFLSNKNIARTTAPGFQESQNATSVNVYGFNRTFIGPYDDSSTKSGNRLSEIQTWVTV
jgi:beta-N-acetylglucosaminidase